MDNSSVNMDLIRDHVDSFILRFLSNGDSYGYDIHKEISIKTEGAYVLKQPTLYSCLKRLEKQGFISSYIGDTSNGGQRKYYSLTDKGRTFLEQDMQQWEFSRTLLNRLLSDKEFDLTSDNKPYDPSSLRPRTKRGVGIAMSDTTDGEISDDDDNEGVLKADKTAQGDFTLNESDEPYQSNFSSNNNSAEKQATVTEKIEKQDVAAPKQIGNESFDGAANNSSAVDAQPGVQQDDTIADTSANEALANEYAERERRRNQAKIRLGLIKPDNEDVKIIPHTQSLDKISVQQLDLDTIQRENEANSKANFPILKDFLNSKGEERVSYRSALDNLFKKGELQSQVAAEAPAISETTNTYNYGELKERVQSQGYKLRPYTKVTTNSYYSMNFIFINRLKRDCLALLYLIMLLEMFILYFTCDKYTSMGFVFYVISICVLLVVPLYGLVLYAAKPDKRVRAQFDLRVSISGAMMVYINAVVLTLLLAFFCFGADITRKVTMILPILYPAVLLANIPLGSLIFGMLYSTKHYHLK